MIELKKYLSAEEVERVVMHGEEVKLSVETEREIVDCYNFLESFSAEKIIYGINTGFGPMAQWRIEDTDLKALQYNIIRSHATGAGRAVESIYVRAALLARLQTFVQARSGVHIELVRLIIEFINRGIYPMIPEHGSVGASGDLVQLAHIALTLIGEGEVMYKGVWRETAEVLKECGLHPFTIHIREGLSVTNGTSMMTGVGMVNIYYAKRLLWWETALSVMVNEIAASYDDMISEELNAVKRHEGQQKIADYMRRWAKAGSA
jgi:histidine ammonia-lyase